ncbi:MAG: tRNA (adenosine(37)-N6)-dimethylallyltransferase MiaA [Muribaculaceae bacterium]|nr:tRNA (adenosine(37)-N6)-dimethylallyltransferase MiaA [Muribaculaceae bacterium]
MDYRDVFFVVTGPTATGKTARAVHLAKAIGGEIISADSRQIYRGMDIGTGKDLDEYDDVPYHLIDIRPAGYRYSLYEFLEDFERVYEDIRGRGKPAIMCGGTGMYVETVIKGIKLPPVPHNEELRAELADKSLDELTALLKTMKTLRNNSDIDTVARATRAIEICRYYEQHPDLKALTEPHPMENALVIGVEVDRDTRRERISRRLRARLDEGMVDEVRRLIDEGIDPENLIYYGLEYKFVTQYVIGQLSEEEMFRQLEIAIHQFAKRQMTWFRGMEKRGTPIHWLSCQLSPNDFTNQVLALANSLSNNKNNL